MRILAFCYEFPPVGAGAGNALYHLAREWSRSGHEVTVVTSLFQDLKSEEKVEGFTLIRLPVHRKYISKGRIREMIAFMVKSTLKSGGFYRRFKPDICMAFMTIPGGLAPLWIKLKYNVPYVTHLRGGDVPGFDHDVMKGYHFLAKPLIRRIWSQSGCVIANSRGLKDLAQKVEPSLSVEIIPNGVDGSRFVSAKKEPSSEPVYLYVGRFVESQKNILEIIRAFAGLKKGRLLLAGDGPDRKPLEILARHLGITHRIEFAGWCRGEKLLNIYQKADIYVSASKWEGMPNAVLEAMATGLPVALSDIPGHREFIENNENGYLFSPDKPDELLKILQRLGDAPSMREEMGRKSRMITERHGDWKKIAAIHLQKLSHAHLHPAKKVGWSLKTWAALNGLFLAVVMLLAAGMGGHQLSDDQITYMTTAQNILGMTHIHTLWNPTTAFGYFLAMSYRLTQDFVPAYILLFVGVALLYLNAMTWCLRYFFKNKVVIASLCVISLVPHYTMAMTYWGFGGIEFIKARILVMPLIPIVLRMFFQWRSSTKIGIPLVLCALGGLLSYESFYLLGILFLFAGIHYIKQKPPAPVLKSFFILGVVSITIAAAIWMIPHLYHGLIEAEYEAGTAGVYRVLIQSDPDLFASLDALGYVNMLWRAMYEGFWWTMFPPRLVDFAFALFNMAILMCFGIWGAVIQRKEDQTLFKANLLFIFCCLIVAYSYPVSRFVGWKFFNTKPDAIEAVRAFKFMFFPLFLFVGAYLSERIRRRQYLLSFISIGLLLISPLEVLRGLPLESRLKLKDNLVNLYPETRDREYISKALQITDSSQTKDISHMIRLLQESEDRPLSPASKPYVLTTLHAVKLSGKRTIISYQDKRIHVLSVDGRQYDRIAYWAFAYQEIRRVLRSRDPDLVVKTANKYRCDYAITEMPLVHPELKTLYDGKSYYLYQIVKTPMIEL